MKKNNPGCGCCLPCNQQGWLDFVTAYGYSGWSISATGTYISYSPTETGGFGTSGWVGNAIECDTNANGATVVTIAGSGTCKLIKSNCGTISNRVCNGVFRTFAATGVVATGSIGTACVDGAPKFTQSASVSVPIAGCNPDYLLPNPVDDLGYFVTQYNFFGDPVAWRKLGTGGYFWQITGCGNADPLMGPIVGGVRKYVTYTVSAYYSRVAVDAGDVLSTITLAPDYNPAGITATISLT